MGSDMDLTVIVPVIGNTESLPMLLGEIKHELNNSQHVLLVLL